MKRIIIFGLIAVLAVNVSAVQQAFAVPDDAVISASCQTVQSTLTKIEKTDVVSRLNRVRSYESLLDSMFAMNARLASNRITSPELSEITAMFEQGLDDFRNDYNYYDDRLGEAIGADCVNAPTDFYNKLTIARSARATLREDIMELSSYIDSYYDELGKISEANKW